MQAEQILLARQPIFDGDMNVAGYELLFRPLASEQGNAWDGEMATTQVILNAFTEFGLETAADNKRVFINFTQAWLANHPPFDPDRVTIEILEDIKPTPEVIASVRALRKEGFQIALDDFVFDRELIPLIKLSHVIKVDVMQYRRDQLERLLTVLRNYPGTLLAEKIEDHETFEFCKAHGFTLFQGYFLCRPQIIEGTAIPSNKLTVMRLMSELQRPDISTDELEGVIAKDPALSVKLLRVFHTAQFRLHSKVDSIKKAIVLLGLAKLKSWATMIALSRLSDKPSELTMVVLTRAKMLEHLALNKQLPNPDAHFTAGLFSALDAFFDQEKLQLLKTLPLESEVNDAILHYHGDLGRLLQVVVQFEQAEWDQIDWGFLDQQAIGHALLEESYYAAIRWAAEMMRSLLEA